jgi:hypothetical protein
MLAQLSYQMSRAFQLGLGPMSRRAANRERRAKVWHNRHMVRREKIDAGEIKVVEKEEYPPKDWRERTVQKDIWRGALAPPRRSERNLEEATMDRGMILNGEWSTANFPPCVGC